MNLELYTGGYVSTNSYLITDGDVNLLIDAPAGVYQWLQQKEISPDYLLLTHQHFDHVEDAHLFSCPIYAHSAFNRELILDKRARERLGIPVTVEPFEVQNLLEGQQELKLDSFHFQLHHTPGHSPDSLVYRLDSANLAFVGDTVFRAGIGRTDLPGGNHEMLIDNIRKKILTLPADDRLYPGHGPWTSPRQEMTP